MKIIADSPQQYIDQLPNDRKEALSKLREVISSNLPEGFEEMMNYGMIGYVVPHTIYPAGYHCDPKLPLPFMNIASQKNFVAIYHMGIYSDKNLMNWFLEEYPNHCSQKLDMGKSCLRFKKIDKIPYALIGMLASKMTTAEWISLYENRYKK